jgi:hypothetical protein
MATCPISTALFPFQAAFDSLALDWHLHDICRMVLGPVAVYLDRICNAVMDFDVPQV